VWQVGGGADPSVVMPHKAVLVDGSTKPRPILILGLALYAASALLIIDRLLPGAGAAAEGHELLLVYSTGVSLAFFYTAPPLKLKYFALVSFSWSLRPPASSLCLPSPPPPIMQSTDLRRVSSKCP